jgi:nucleoside-diphosphate-sugar epimerase
MHVLITGADRPLARAVAQHLASEHETRCVGQSVNATSDPVACNYQVADLRLPLESARLVDNIETIIHLDTFDRSHRAEQSALEHATLGTYVLCQEARKAGVQRIVVVGTLAIYDAYSSSYTIDEQWRPRPAANAEQLAPHLCEHVVHAFVREGGISGICLRFLPVGDDRERSTRLADALQAVDRALSLPLTNRGYAWQVFHIASSPRFIMRQAKLHLGFRMEE